MAKSPQIMIDIGQGLSLMLSLPTLNTWETSTRPIKPKRGTIGFNSQTSSLEFYDGTSWMKAQMT